MRYPEDDLETEAIARCTKALTPLDDKTKIRVIKYLLERYNLLAQQEPEKKQDIINQTIQYQQNNLLLVEPEQVPSFENQSGFNSSSYPSLKDVLIRSLAKSEPELLLVLVFYASNYGRDTFGRQKILETYRDNGIYTELRNKGLSQNLKSLIKKFWIRTISDDEIALSPEGIEYVQEILKGNSSTKQRSPRSIKKKQKTKQIEYQEDTNKNE